MGTIGPPEGNGAGSASIYRSYLSKKEFQMLPQLPAQASQTSGLLISAAGSTVISATATVKSKFGRSSSKVLVVA